MLWFEPFPWARWALVWAIALTAIVLEALPENRTDHLFAVRDIERGEVLGDENTEVRQAPEGLLATAQIGDVTRSAVAKGDPILLSAVAGEGSPVPADWWIVALPVPGGARPGDPVRVVLLDSGEQVEGIVASPGSDDPFAADEGSVAVPAEWSAMVATAGASGRVAVLIAGG